MLIKYTKRQKFIVSNVLQGCTWIITITTIDCCRFGFKTEELNFGSKNVWHSRKPPIKINRTIQRTVQIRHRLKLKAREQPQRTAKECRRMLNQVHRIPVLAPRLIRIPAAYRVIIPRMVSISNLLTMVRFCVDILKYWVSWCCKGLWRYVVSLVIFISKHKNNPILHFKRLLETDDTSLEMQ